MISIVKYNRCMTGEHNFIETDVELSTTDVAELDSLFQMGTIFEKIIELEAISSELYQDLISYIGTDNINNILSKKSLIK